jgi:hypothetical protein
MLALAACGGNAKINKHTKARYIHNISGFFHANGVVIGLAEATFKLIKFVAATAHSGCFCTFTM